MTTLLDNQKGGYRYLPSQTIAYADAVVAMPGYTLQRVVLNQCLPMARGFELIKRTLEQYQRPLEALCGCELRSPGPLSGAQFTRFNQVYGSTLSAWGLIEDQRTMVARSNVCPIRRPPAEPGLQAFSFTIPEPSSGRSTFILSGVSEETDDGAIIAAGDSSAGGLETKAAWVIQRMTQLLDILQAAWEDCTGVQIYTAHDLHALLNHKLLTKQHSAFGLTWHLARPPVVANEFEMDCRRVLHERILCPAEQQQ